MPNRYFSSPAYRFGFNGMEKDDEMKGSTGTSYDFGARMYDSRLARWMSTDLKESKYPNISPYVFVANTPTVFVDKDGKDFDVLVNHNNKTITIRANFLTINQSDKEQLLAAFKMWQAFEGELETKQGEVYTIKFEVIVNEIPKGLDGFQNSADGAANTDDDENMNSFETKTSILFDKIYWATKQETAEKTGGLTAFNKNIVIPDDNRANVKTLAHEVGHVLLLADNTGTGIMLHSHTNLQDVNDVNIGDAISVIMKAIRAVKNDFKGKKTKGIKVKTEGEPKKSAKSKSKRKTEKSKWFGKGGKKRFKKAIKGAERNKNKGKSKNK